MKSPDVLDPRRLSVNRAYIGITEHHEVEVTVVLRYDPWEPSAGQDVMWEQANALTCVRDALTKGGVE